MDVPWTKGIDDKISPRHDSRGVCNSFGEISRPNNKILGGSIMPYQVIILNYFLKKRCLFRPLQSRG